VKKITVEVYLTTGQTFKMKCEKFNLQFDGNGECSRYTIEGHKAGHGLIIEPKYIAGIRRIK